ncbi:MAG: nucleotidyltransferase family protein [Mucilaginibacter polytrichastri]|nr:nucleotidyltransferase family protein [Mucilaginibacter polytrichastri]
MSTAAIILAAGGSSRMGKPKQLLVFDGKTLLKSACEAAHDSGCRPVLVITGKEHEALLPEIPAGSIIIHHENWASGIGSSISAGVAALQKIHSETGSVLILLSDQPYAESELLHKLIRAKNTGKNGIIASAYAGTMGAPAIFDRTYFAELTKLAGDEGAKKILSRHSDDITAVDFPGGVADIDTPEDYEALNNPENTKDK